MGFRRCQRLRPVALGLSTGLFACKSTIDVKSDDAITYAICGPCPCGQREMQDLVQGRVFRV